MASDKVSVIIPVYNVEQYLEECVAAVIGQTYKNLEIILVDDGATDSSGEMCDRLATTDKRIIVVHKENAGLNMARMSGFAASTGDWVTFIDSDDVPDKNYVSYLMDAAKKYQSELSMCAYQYFVDTYHSNTRQLRSFSWSAKKAVKAYLLDGRPGEDFFMQTAWGKLFSRRLIEAIDWNFSNYRVNEDEFMSTMYYAELKTPLAIVDNQLLYYRQRPDSIMGQITKEYKNTYQGRSLTKFEYLAEVYDKRMQKFGRRYANEIAYWFGLHFMINLSKAYGDNPNALTQNDRKLFDDRFSAIVKASKTHRYWGEQEYIFEQMKRTGGIAGFFEYKEKYPLVSVIIPVYNAEKFLDQCLESVINQSYTNLEIIMVNDGSNDGSLAICQRFAGRDYRVRVVSQENAGVSRARNAGIELARGRYVTFVDSDDFLEHTAIERLVGMAQKDGHASQVYIGGIYDHHSVGYNFTYQPNDLPTEIPISYDNDPAKYTYVFLTKINSPFAKLYDRDLLHQYNIRFHEEIRIGEDMLFAFQALVLAHSIVYTDTPVYYYRNDFTNNYSAIGTMNDDKVLDFAKAFEGVYKIISDRSLNDDADVMSAFRQSVVAHALYTLAVAEKNSAAHEKAFIYIKQQLIGRYQLLDADATSDDDKRQLKAIINGSYNEYVLMKLTIYKAALHQLIDRREMERIQPEAVKLSRAVAKRVAPYLSHNQKRQLKRIAGRLKREVGRVRRQVKRLHK